jgi:Holliday junction resolvase RusA-like endonuclease
VIIVELPGEPRGKGRPRSRIAKGKAGQQFVAVYTDAKTRAFEKALAWAGKAAMGARQPLLGPLAVTVEAVFGVPRSWSRPKRDSALAGVLRPTGAPDADNCGKIALDGLNGVLWGDDSQIVDLHITKRYGEEPMLRVEIAPIGPPLAVNPPGSGKGG